MRIKSNWKRAWPLALLVSLAGCGSPQSQTAPPIVSVPTAATRDASGDASGNVAGNASISRIPVDGTSTTASIGNDNGNLLLGNPSGAGTDANNRLVERPQHALSYNQAKGGPNWVAWHTEKKHLGAVRRGDFLPDPLLPPEAQIRPNDYRGSGYDRGHVCPSGDRTATRQDNTATFVMSNMLPQTAALNQHVWKKLEDYSRSLVQGGNELYTVAGGVGSQGRIGSGKVNVPQSCWKIIVVLPQGEDDLARIAAGTRVIAVLMPNQETPQVSGARWSQYLTNVAALEKVTGYDFLSALPDEVERALEQKLDSGRTAGTGISVGRDSGGFERGRSTERVALGKQSPSEQRPPATSAQVWVNTRSGVYHFPGARWYGKTKDGEYLSEREAQTRGYRAAENGH